MDFCQSMARVATPVYEGAVVTRVNTTDIRPKGFVANGFVYIDEATGDSTKPVRILLNGIITVMGVGKIDSGSPVFVVIDPTDDNYGYVTADPTTAYAGIALSSIAENETGICAVAFTFSPQSQPVDDPSKLDEFDDPLGTIFHDGNQKTFYYYTSTAVEAGKVYNRNGAVITECVQSTGSTNYKVTLAYSGCVLMKYHGDVNSGLCYRPEVYCDMAQTLSDGVYIDPVGLRRPYKFGRIVSYVNLPENLAWVELDYERPYDTDEYVNLEYVTDNCYIPSKENVIEYDKILDAAPQYGYILPSISGVITHVAASSEYKADVIHKGVVMLVLGSSTNFEIGCPLYVNKTNATNTVYPFDVLDETRRYKVGRAVTNKFAYNGLYYVWVALEWGDLYDDVNKLESFTDPIGTIFHNGQEKLYTFTASTIYTVGHIYNSAGGVVVKCEGSGSSYTVTILTEGIVMVSWTGDIETWSLRPEVYSDLDTVSSANVVTCPVGLRKPYQVGHMVNSDLNTRKAWIRLDYEDHFSSHDLSSGTVITDNAIIPDSSNRVAYDFTLPSGYSAVVGRYYIADGTCGKIIHVKDATNRICDIAYQGTVLCKLNNTTGARIGARCYVSSAGNNEYISAESSDAFDYPLGTIVSNYFTYDNTNYVWVSLDACGYARIQNVPNTPTAAGILSSMVNPICKNSSGTAGKLNGYFGSIYARKAFNSTTDTNTILVYSGVVSVKMSAAVQAGNLVYATSSDATTFTGTKPSSGWIVGKALNYASANNFAWVLIDIRAL